MRGVRWWGMHMGGMRMRGMRILLSGFSLVAAFGSLEYKVYSQMS
jgi:hypothetical protein